MIIFSGLSQTLRSLKANRTYNIINILGLSLGLASTFILLKIILHEKNTDKFHDNYNQICYSTIRMTPLSSPRHSFINFGSTDIQDYPEIKSTTGFAQIPNAELKIDNEIYKTNLTEVDSSFTEVFDFPLLYGDYRGLFEDPNSIILSKTLSERLFGTTMSLGETMEIVEKKVTVVGIIDDMPGNSSLNFNAIVSTYFHDFHYMGAQFILLNENVDLKAFNEKIKFLGRDHQQSPVGIQECRPFGQLYFDTDNIKYHGELIHHGNIRLVKILILIASLLFAVSIFNYLNIYLVTLQKRAKEIGILCINGADRSYLAKYFLRENIISIGLSAVIALLIYSFLNPYVPVFFGKTLPISLGKDLLLLTGVSTFILIVASIITSQKFRKISPILYIKDVSTGVRALFARRISTTIQYTVTIVLIIVSIFFIKQLNYMLKADMGFKSKNIICVPFFTMVEIDWELDSENRHVASEKYKNQKNIQRSNQQYVIDEINRNPYVQYLSFGTSPFENHTAPWKNMNSDEDYMDGVHWQVTPQAEELFGLNVIEGRFFDDEIDKGRQHKILINQTAKAYYNVEDIEKVTFANRYWGDDYKVLGVIKDFSFDHLSKEVEPMILLYFGDKVDNNWMMEISEGKEAEVIEFIKQLFEKVNPGKSFEYHFVKDEMDQLYSNDEMLVRVYSLFTIIALIISSLGLFSFSIYDVQQRFKEIGIRKANGSGTWETVLYLTKNVYTLLGISFVIAVPIAWFGISKYLEGFANKAPLSWWIFALAALFTLVISVLTVIIQSYRAATKNPVEALRYE